LLFSSCGPAQWRLGGPDQDENAISTLQKVPLTPLCNAIGVLCLGFVVLLMLGIFNNPALLLTTFGLTYFLYKQFYD
jgi:hypothetical protein